VKFRIILVFLMVLLCGGCTKSVKLDDNIESIPKDVALKYLLNTSNRCTDDKCLYTLTGVAGIPYSNLEYEIKWNIWGWNTIILWKKDEKQRFTIAGQENKAWVCTPFYPEKYTDVDLTPEEYDEIIKKTASALTALGAGRVE